MPSDVKEAPGPRTRSAAGEQALPVLDPALAKLAAHASKIRTRKGQSIGLTLDGHEAACLNPDTLSRIVARLRRDGILGHSVRNRVPVRDFRALARLTPAARSLAAIHQHRRGDGLVLFA